jgi:hypothetical protein
MSWPANHNRRSQVQGDEEMISLYTGEKIIEQIPEHRQNTEKQKQTRRGALDGI